MVSERVNIDLSGRTAIVTGASRGIGKAIALALGKAKANVVVAARTVNETPALPGTVYKTAEEIRKAGGISTPVRCDVTVPDEVQNMVEIAVGTYGTIDILVNNAGMLLGTNFMQTEIPQFIKLINTNILGPFLCTRAVIPYMIRQRRGNIISISSSLAEQDRKNSNAYSASKTALNRMMLNLSLEVTEHNIAVNILYPGMIKSEGMIAGARSTSQEVLDKLPPPSVVGPAAVWLAAQTGATFTGNIVRAATFGTEWPKAST